MQLKPVMRIWR